MKPDFGRCRARLDGADDDRKALAAEVLAAYESYGGKPVGFGTDTKDYGPGRARVWGVVTSVMSVPVHWDRRIAHVIYDTRSALDHLTHELYVATNGRRPPKNVAGVLQFPICDTRGAWTSATTSQNKRLSRLEGIDPRYVKVIRDYQPFWQGRSNRKKVTTNALRRLRNLSDRDKHRRPHVVFFAPLQASLTFAVNYGCVIIGNGPNRLGRAVSVGARVGYVDVAATGEGSGSVRVDFQGTLYPAFERGVSIGDLMASVIVEARSVVDECEAAT